MTATPTKNTNRKALIQELTAETGAEVKYLGAPSFAYQVGPYTINKDASIGGDDLEAIRDFLVRHDYDIQAPTPAQADAAEADLKAGDAPATLADEIKETKVSVPTVELTPLAITNLLKLIYAKQSMIAAMTRSDFIFIDEEVVDLMNDEKPNSMDAISKLVQDEARFGMIRGIELALGALTFTFPFDKEQPANWASYAKLLTALIDRAKAAKHINSKRVEPAEGEMKYYCNSLLMQLGFGGADFKADRATLLGHLPGYAAFKTIDKMEAHKAKFSERRKAARQADAANADGNLKATDEGSTADTDEGSGEEVMA